MEGHKAYYIGFMTFIFFYSERTERILQHAI
jgi:hypothetical protein